MRVRLMATWAASTVEASVPAVTTARPTLIPTGTGGYSRPDSSVAKLSIASGRPRHPGRRGVQRVRGEIAVDGLSGTIGRLGDRLNEQVASYEGTLP